MRLSDLETSSSAAQLKRDSATRAVVDAFVSRDLRFLFELEAMVMTDAEST